MFRRTLTIGSLVAISMITGLTAQAQFGIVQIGYGGYSPGYQVRSFGYSNGYDNYGNNFGNGAYYGNGYGYNGYGLNNGFGYGYNNGFNSYPTYPNYQLPRFYARPAVTYQNRGWAQRRFR